MQQTLIGLFKRNIVLQVVLILAVLVLFWIRPLMAAPIMTEGSNPAVLYGLLCRWMRDVPLLAVVIAMVLVLVEGVMLNLLLAKVGLVSQNGLLPTLLYVVVCSIGACTLTPYILVNGVMIACLHQLMLRGTLLTISVEKACGATALIALASLFYQPAILFVLSYILVAANYRLYGWKDWMVLLLGLAAPYISVICVLSFTGGLEEWWSLTVESLTWRGFGKTNITAIELAGAVLMGVLVLWAILQAVAHLSEHTVLWQKNASVVMLMLIGGVGVMLYSDVLPLRIAILAMPLSFCFSGMLLRQPFMQTGSGRQKQRAWVYDVMLVIIIVAGWLC